MPDLDAEDEKLVTLARSSLLRSQGAREGAAVRDDIGRTYTATAVSLGPMDLSALELAAAMAASSGVTRLEAAAYANADGSAPTDRARAVVAALGDPVVHVVHVDG